jgi:hypothetical protein
MWKERCSDGKKIVGYIFDIRAWGEDRELSSRQYVHYDCDFQIFDHSEDALREARAQLLAKAIDWSEVTDTSTRVIVSATDHGGPFPHNGRWYKILPALGPKRDPIEEGRILIHAIYKENK